MHANQEINRVGVEMTDLKHLIEDTKKMLQVSHFSTLHLLFLIVGI
jgi:hypothetical protein